MRKQMRRIAAALFTAVLCVGACVHAEEVTMDEAEQKAGELEQQKKDAEAKKNSLETQLNTILENMNVTSEKLAQKESEIEAAENELVQAKVNADEQYQSMKIRIKYMYEGGNTSALEILMKSSSIGDFLNKAEYVTKLSEYDRNELIRYQDTVKEVTEREASLQNEHAELEGLQNELISQQGEVQKLLEDNAAQIEEIQNEIKANDQVIAELKRQAEEARRKQEEQRRAEEAARKAAEEAKKAAAQQQSSGSSSRPNNNVVVSGNGYFTHPCPGMTYQSSYFGEIREFETGGHKGHDYAAPVGTPTYAAAAGTVVIAGYSSSAGNWVVINHGDGLVTKYMHHSSICVSAGQYVQKGQQIGCVGSTGQSTGPHLHFQVELNGVAVNPDLYL